MEIDDAAAARLYSQSRAGRLAANKEVMAHEVTHVAILGIPCDVSFGFISKQNFAGLATIACVWIFGSGGQDFFGSLYSPIGEESHAPSILNATIAKAIDQAKANPKFKAALRKNEKQ